MGSSQNKELNLFNEQKKQEAEGNSKVTKSVQMGFGRASIRGRPNIDEISKRNELEEKQDRKLLYIKTVIVALLIIIFMFLIYFFS